MASRRGTPTRATGLSLRLPAPEAQYRRLIQHTNGSTRTIRWPSRLIRTGILTTMGFRWLRTASGPRPRFPGVVRLEPCDRHWNRGAFNAKGCGPNALPINPFNQGYDRGSSCFDKKYNFHLNVLYHLPSPKSGGFWLRPGVVGGSAYRHGPNRGPLTANLGSVDRSRREYFRTTIPGLLQPTNRLRLKQ